jgi:hypothetical protein
VPHVGLAPRVHTLILGSGAFRNAMVPFAFRRWVIRWPPRYFINLGPLPVMSTQPLTDARCVFIAAACLFIVSYDVID